MTCGCLPCGGEAVQSATSFVSPGGSGSFDTPSAKRQFIDDRKAVRSTTAALSPRSQIEEMRRQFTPPKSPSNGPKSPPTVPKSPPTGPLSPPPSPLDTRSSNRRQHRSCMQGVCAAIEDILGHIGRALGTEKSRLRTGSATPPSAADKQEDEEHRRRWYRVSPIAGSDELYAVRADPGLAGRSMGHPDAGKTTPLLEEEALQKPGVDPVVSRVSKLGGKRGSLPHSIDRMVGMEEPGLNDTFTNWCKLCYDRYSDVVVLPCKHGGFCELCLRQTILKKPDHKGGRQCPWCRKRITEVIKLYSDGAAVKGYGYAISVGSFK